MSGRSILIVVTLLGLVAPAHARQPEPKKVTLQHTEHLRVFHDGKGNYLVVPDGAAMMKQRRLRKALGRQVFFGTRKKLYRQLRNGFSRNGDFYQYGVTDGRARTPQSSRFVHDPRRQTFFQCDGRKTGLSALSEAEARRLFKTAEFRDVYWRRVIHLVARDDLGRYYVIDRLPHGKAVDHLHHPVLPRGVRLWIGPRGKMKRMRLRNTIADPAGQILITGKGRLKLTTKVHRTVAAEWQQPVAPAKGPCARCPCPCAGKVHVTKLTLIKAGFRRSNYAMVYKQLGPYLGIKLRKPCDVW